MSRLNAKQEAFAKAVVTNGGDKVAAYKAAGYSLGLNPNAMAVQADKLFNHPKISLRIAELQDKADKVAEKEFSISVRKRLEWLNEIVEAGLETRVRYIGESSVEQRENLNASTAAIKVMNEMLGTDEKDDQVKPVKVIIGVQDAS